MAKQEFWRRKLHNVPAQFNPFRLKPLEISKPILVKPSIDPAGYKRRIRQVVWTCREKLAPGDKDHVQVYLANKRIGIPADPGVWEIVLYNATGEEVTVDVFGIEEEMIGTVDIV